MPKITSEIWKHFSQRSGKLVECKVCSKQLTVCGNTTNFWNHLLIHGIKKHQVQKQNTSSEIAESTETSGLTTPSQARKKRKRSNLEPSDKSVSESPKEKQYTLEETYDKVKSYTDGGTHEVLLNDALFMICKAHLPLITSQKEGFKYFANVAVPLWRPPSRNVLTSLCETKYNALKMKVCQAISELPSVSLTFDVWTEQHSTTSYLGGTLHYLQENSLEMCTLSITELNESHTANYLQEYFLKICDTWSIDINKITLVVTDNASNITKAAKETFETTVPCFDHTLNLIPSYAIGTDSQGKDYVAGVPEIINKVKQIVSFIHKSVSASDDLKKRQLENGASEGTVLRLVQEVSTRWSSAYFMLVRFLELADILGVVLLKYPKVTMLTGAELLTLRLIANILHPFQLATAEMAADRTTTVSKVIPMVCLLRQRVCGIETEGDRLAIKIQNFVISELDRRFKSMELVTPIAVACILDPRFKKLYFQSAVAVSKAINFIATEIKKSLAEKVTISDLESPLEPKKVSDNSLWALHDENVKAQQKTHTEDYAGGLPTELRYYLNRPVLPRETDPFAAWNTMKHEYPHVYNLARKYLPLTATSVPSERLFSEAKLVISSLRSRLTSAHASQLIFLSSISMKLWKSV